MYYDYLNNDHDLTETGINVLDINIHKTQIIFNFKHDNIFKKQYALDLEDLQTMPGYTDMTAWLLVFDGSLDARTVVNAYAGTLESKQTSFLSAVYNAYPVKVYLKVLSKHADFTGISMRVILPSGIALKSNKIFTQLQIIDTKPTAQTNVETFERAIIPKIEGPLVIKKDTIETLYVTPYLNGAVINKPTTIYLRSNSGYLPKQIVEASGRTAFKVSALGLEMDDEIELNVGFKFWSGVTYYSLKVIE